MLNKSILLNLRMIKSDMGTAVGLMIICAVLYMFASGSIFFPGGTVVLLATLLVYIIFYIRVVNKICFRSFFDDEGSMYMTLPISAKETVLGKVLTIAGFSTFMQVLLIAGMMLFLFFTGVSTDSLLSSLAADLPPLDESRLETSIAFGLMPISVFASCLFSATLILTVFLKLGLQKKKLLPCWIIYFIISKAVIFVIEQIGKLFDDISLGIVLDEMIGILFYLVITSLLVKYCVKNLEERYDV